MESNELRLPSRQSTASTRTQTCCPTSLLVSPLGETHNSFVFAFFYTIKLTSTKSQPPTQYHPWFIHFHFSYFLSLFYHFLTEINKTQLWHLFGQIHKVCLCITKNSALACKRNQQLLTIMCTVHIASLWGWDLFSSFIVFLYPYLRSLKTHVYMGI